MINKKVQNRNKHASKTSKYNNAKDFEIAVNKYFEQCDREEIPPTISGLTLALGFKSRQTLLNYENEDRNTDIPKKEKKKIVDIIREAKLRIEKDLEERLITGKNVVGIIFNLKNNFGYVDKVENENKSEIIITVSGVNKF